MLLCCISTTAWQVKNHLIRPVELHVSINRDSGRFDKQFILLAIWVIKKKVLVHQSKIENYVQWRTYLRVGGHGPPQFLKKYILVYKFIQNFRSWPLIFIFGPPPTKVLQIDKWKPKRKLFDRSFCPIVYRTPR